MMDSVAREQKCVQQVRAAEVTFVIVIICDTVDLPPDFGNSLKDHLAPFVTAATNPPLKGSSSLIAVCYNTFNPGVDKGKVRNYFIFRLIPVFSLQQKR